MKNYEYKYLTEAMRAEVNELLKGEHGEALMAWCSEAGDLAVKAFKEGIVRKAWHGVVYGCAAYGAFELIKSFATKRKAEKAEKHKAATEVLEAEK